MNIGSSQPECFDVVVVDDHLSYAQALVMALRADRPSDRVACFATADELFAVADLAKVVLLDWQLGDVARCAPSRAGRRLTSGPWSSAVRGSPPRSRSVAE
jgi:hypothetical protein